MALVDVHFFQKVKLGDFYGTAWMKQTAAENGVTMWIEHCNKISRWIASKVLSEPKKESRAKMIGKFIKLMDVRIGALRFAFPSAHFLCPC